MRPIGTQRTAKRQQTQKFQHNIQKRDCTVHRAAYSYQPPYTFANNLRSREVLPQDRLRTLQFCFLTMDATYYLNLDPKGFSHEFPGGRERVNAWALVHAIYSAESSKDPRQATYNFFGRNLKDGERGQLLAADGAEIYADIPGQGRGRELWLGTVTESDCSASSCQIPRKHENLGRSSPASSLACSKATTPLGLSCEAKLTRTTTYSV